ncbi:MAG: 4-hydroxy-tetrahydrodipicolinate synthase [Anaerolineales bacterium]|nr:4-hydroxy-tetrahydrodipicolinate synthase [Anaerolineales bacterium]
MKNNLFRGVTTALVTPFLADKSVDYQGLRQNVRFQIENGVKGLLPLGTTGETPTLTESEKKKIVQTVVEEVKASGRPVRVLQGVGTNSTEKTIENTRQAIDWGVDAVLIVTPYYNKPTQEGIVAHFTAVNDVVNIPIVVYNIKGRTGVNIETGTLQRIAELENVVAVKEASGDINQMMDVLSRIPELAVYSGDDGMTFPLICLGGQGVISVVSNLFPQQVVAMTEHALEGRTEAARKIHFNLLPFFKAAFIETNPAPIKYAMAYKGLAAGPLRLPLVQIRDESKVVVEKVLKQM